MVRLRPRRRLAPWGGRGDKQNCRRAFSGPTAAAPWGPTTAWGVALMLWLALHRHQMPHPPVLLLFTACEERGLVGARP